MSQLPRFLRVGLAGISIYVLSVIVRVSITQWQTGDACPMIGPIPACYEVSVSYAAMGLASLLWTKPLQWLFFAGATPVILLALASTAQLAAERATHTEDINRPFQVTGIGTETSHFAEISEVHP